MERLQRMRMRRASENQVTDGTLGPTQQASTLASPTVPVVKRPVYEVRLEAFEGPLDLLLHLIREHEIDIYDIPIAAITEQYLEYIRLMETLDLALAGEFLEMAATLIRIKVRMLLPPPIDESVEEEDPREQLVRQLVEYKKFKEAAQTLSGYEIDRRDHFQHGVDTRVYHSSDEDEIETGDFLRDLTLFDLVDCLREVLARIPERIDVHEVNLDQISVEDQLEFIRERIRTSDVTTFRALFISASGRAEIVATFIALLELIRLGEIVAAQSSVFGEIEIKARMEGQQ